MNKEKLKSLLPQASHAFIKLNCSDLNTRQPSIVERAPEYATLGKVQGKARDTRRFLVRVTDVRRRLLDQDNLCEKYHVDCCRYNGWLPSDNPSQTSIETTQRKAKEGEEPHVEIEVYQVI